MHLDITALQGIESSQRLEIDCSQVSHSQFIPFRKIYVMKQIVISEKLKYVSLINLLTNESQALW